MSDPLEYSGSSIKDNIWPVSIDSLFIPENSRNSLVYNHDEEEERPKKKLHALRRRLACCPCLECYWILLICIGLVLLAALAALIVSLLVFHKKGDYRDPLVAYRTRPNTTIYITHLTTSPLFTPISATARTTRLETPIKESKTTTIILTKTNRDVTNVSIPISTSTVIPTSTAITTSTTSTTLTTSTTPTTSTTLPTTTVTTSTTTLTSTITSTMTTTIYCGESCLYRSWIDTTGMIGLWPFEDSYDDKAGLYHGYPSLNLPLFTTGFIGQAVLFRAEEQNAIYTSFIPLHEVSFTFEAWIKPMAFTNPTDDSIVGLCPSQIEDYCLHINLRNRRLYFGFYYNDVEGTTTVELDRWTHIGCVFNMPEKTLTVYLNGQVDGVAQVTSPLMVTSGNFTIGTNEGVALPDNFFEGYIDELSVNARPKSYCEILESATLGGHFKFDSSDISANSGPQRVSVSTSSIESKAPGYKNDAISILGTDDSYFQASGFTAFSMDEQPFSLSMWIQPKKISGTLVHFSVTATGGGNHCFPMLGFNTDGALVAQVMAKAGQLVSTVGPVLSTSSTWTFITQTWSPSNGLRLYVNNTLASSNDVNTFVGSGITPNYLTLGSCINGCRSCPMGGITGAGPYQGFVDDWRVFLRDLTPSDICTLHYYS